MTVDPALTGAARTYGEFLAASTLFSHEADGRRPVDRIKAAGYQPCSVSENLAWRSDPRGFETLALATQMVQGWKTSPGHRRNLLMEHAIETGVAIVKARREEKYFAVQLFARPAALRYTFAVENRAERAVVYTLGDQETRLAPHQIMTHTACQPVVVAIETKPGGPLTKAVSARYEAKGGQVYRLSGAKGGDIAVEVGTK